MDATEFFLSCIIIIGFFAGAFAGYNLGLIDGSMPDLKEECEKDLPRSQQCIMQYVPEGE